jgi:hypothetical protein
VEEGVGGKTTDVNEKSFFLSWVPLEGSFGFVIWIFLVIGDIGRKISKKIHGN